jgi:hypothetical protein
MANILGLDINIVVLFRAVAPFLAFGLLLEGMATWAQRLIPGRLGGILAEIARSYVPAFIYMVPVEVAYIILFVAVTIKIPYVWEDNHFPWLFLPGLLVLPFIFNRKTFLSSVKITYRLIIDSTAWVWNKLWDKWLYAFWYRLTKKKRIKPRKPKVPWGFLIAGALQAVWTVAVVTVVAVLMAQIFIQGFDRTSMVIAAVGFALVFLITLALGYLRWKHPPQPHSAVLSP